MDVILGILATTTVGIMVGVELAVAVVVNPITLRLPAGPSLSARADGARMLGASMPVWYIVSLVLTSAFAALTWGSASASTAAIAAVLAVSVIMSVTLLVPINNRTRTWTAEAHPTDWREQVRRWDRLHIVRVAVIVAAFALLASAATIL